MLLHCFIDTLPPASFDCFRLMIAACRRLSAIRLLLRYLRCHAARGGVRQESAVSGE